MNVLETAMSRLLAPKREALLSKLSRQGTAPKVLGAMGSVDRTRYAPLYSKHQAYDDRVLPIITSAGRSSLSQPSVVAIMTTLLNPQAGDRILSVGTATGYQDHVLSLLVQPGGSIVSVEVDKKLARSAQILLRSLGVNNVQVIVADGTLPFTKQEAFDRAMFTASMIPESILPIYDAIKEHGVCVVPVGGADGYREACNLAVLRKENGDLKVETALPHYSFVISQGALGWLAYDRHIRNSRFERFFTPRG